MVTKVKPAMMDISEFSKTILDDVDAASVRTTIGANDASNLDSGTIPNARLPATITSNISGVAATATKLATPRTINGVAFDGTANISIADDTKQPADATLTALAGVTGAANKIVYFTGVDVVATTDFTSFARTLLDDADAATMRATLGANNASNLTTGTVNNARLDPTLGALAGVTTGADTVPYFTGTDTASTFPVTTLAKSLLADTSQAEMQGTLGVAELLGGMRGLYKNLKIVADQIGAPTHCAVTYSALVVADSGCTTSKTLVNGSLSILSNTVGANGHESAVVNSAKWMYVYVIYNPTTATVAGLLSDSITTPILPSGYTQYARVGTVLSDVSGYVYQSTQIGNYIKYTTFWKTADKLAIYTPSSTPISHVPNSAIAVCMKATYNCPSAYDSAEFGGTAALGFTCAPRGVLADVLTFTDTLPAGATLHFKITAGFVDLYVIGYYDNI